MSKLVGAKRDYETFIHHHNNYNNNPSDVWQALVGVYEKDT